MFIELFSHTPGSAGYSWVTLGKYCSSHCLSFPICKMERVKYLLGGVVRIKAVYVHYIKGFAQRKYYTSACFYVWFRYLHLSNV